MQYLADCSAAFCMGHKGLYDRNAGCRCYERTVHLQTVSKSFLYYSGGSLFNGKCQIGMTDCLSIEESAVGYTIDILRHSDISHGNGVIRL